MFFLPLTPSLPSLPSKEKRKRKEVKKILTSNLRRTRLKTKRMEKESKERRVTGREKGNRKKDGGELDVSGCVLHLAIP